MKFMTIEAILNEDRSNRGGYNSEYSHHGVTPSSLGLNFADILGLDESLELKAFCHYNRNAYGPGYRPTGSYYGYGYGHNEKKPEDSVMIATHPVSINVKAKNYNDKYDQIKANNIQLEDLIISHGCGSYYDYGGHNCVLSFRYGPYIIPVTTNYKIAERLFNLTIQQNGTILQTCDSHGTPWTREWKVSLDRIINTSSIDYDYRRNQKVIKFDFTFGSLPAISHFTNKTDSLNNILLAILNYEEPAKSVDDVIAQVRDGSKGMPPIDLGWPKLSGIKKTFDKVLPVAESLKFSDTYTYMAFRSLVAQAKRSIDGVGLSTVFNHIFANVTTAEQMAEVLAPFKDEKARTNSWRNKGFDETCRELSFFKEKRKKILKTTTNRAFTKLMEDFEFLDLNEEKYPLTYEAVSGGEIPVSTFFRKKEQYFLLNDNFALWEEMLEKHRETAIELAKEVSKRTTYEKDLMSYFYFILYDLPAYMERHTGCKWTCMPKMVDSPSELDPPKADEVGVARNRSALTPIVDNEAKTVTVPYASLAMPGRQTTYCYSHTYNVLHRGLAFKGNTCLTDLEEKLNGRDDYGLMFYTLTGSPQGRGYPTFLIIFERLQAAPGFPVTTRVHFHRTHPCRSKDGDYNPIHNWIKVCYNWMIGNVLRTRFRNQQGDLAFLEAIATEQVEFTGQQVTTYDHHKFSAPVLFAPYTKKEKANCLGYVALEKETELSHNEHMTITLQPGVYEIRQCRSWEANPQGVWTLNID